MYKVLVTTVVSAAGRGVAVHTVVVEFGDRSDAYDAVRIIKEANSTESNCLQTAVLLW